MVTTTIPAKPATTGPVSGISRPASRRIHDAMSDRSVPPGLAALGWDKTFAAAFAALNDAALVPARVGIEHNHIYRVVTADGERMAQAAGRLRHEAAGQDQLPAVGDWVAVALNKTDDTATIRFVLPRRSSFARKAAGDPTTRQVVAANIDVVLVVAGLDRDFNPRRIARYLVAVAESGARPAVVLNKCDLCDDLDAAIAQVRDAAPGVPIHATCGKTGEGVDQLQPYLAPGRTAALLGSSGTGKSTLINRLLGEERQRTQPVRGIDQRGRHTTIHRELILGPGGGLIIDTPGLRELQIWDSARALEDAFADIDELAADCRFRDCQHGAEPGCAVRDAVDAGRLDPARLDQYRHLAEERELLVRRREELARRQERAQTRRKR
ncbi:MAG: ribosome small subunit-dependent GTPase A [Acidobacteria bacterium]|nr:ribosome small subunit-dependent GTPase A [Acidobacteriota bacterium]